MENKIKKKINEINEIRDSKKTIKELERILEEISNENAKMPSEERIKEIVRGRKGRLEDAKKISYDLRDDRKKSFKIKGIKSLIITVNIVCIALPYVVCGTTAYEIMKHDDIPPYHQNNHQVAEYIYEYWNSKGENKLLTEKDMEKYNNHSLIIYSPWEQNKNGEYYRNRFYDKGNKINEEEIEEILSKDISDILADTSFNEVTVETSKEKPENLDAKVEIIQKHKDYENATIKQNSKEKIVSASIFHAVTTAVLGTSVLGLYTHIRGKKGKNSVLFDDKLEELDRENKSLYTKEVKKEKKNKIKELRKK